MKNVVLKYVSALMAVWYCMSIIGFDVHACTATGDTFVSSVLKGTTCDDIHPDHDCCGHGACCGSHDRHETSCCSCHPEDPHSEGIQESENDCCTNDIEVLDSESITFCDDDMAHFAEVSVSVYVENNYDALLFGGLSEFSYSPYSGNMTLPDQQAVLNIWRI